MKLQVVTLPLNVVPVRVRLEPGAEADDPAACPGCAGPAADRICRCAGPRSAIGYPAIHGVCQVGGGASGVQIGGTCADRRCAGGGEAAMTDVTAVYGGG